VEQTVDRVVAPPASRPTTVATGSRFRDERPRQVYEIELALLPVRSGRELALELARQWQDWSGGQAAVVVIGFLALGRNWIARCESGKLPEVTEADFNRAQAEAGFPACVDVSARTSASQPTLAASLPFSTAADSIAGVLLYSTNDVELRSQACHALTALSGKLVDQAGIVEAASDARRALVAAKAEALAEFAAGAGHEINNPLATIAGRVQMLLRDETDFNRRQDLATIGAQAMRVRDMIGDLMLFARPPAPSPKRLVLNEVAQSVVDRFRDRRQAARSIDLKVFAEGPVFATADASQVQIVLSELLRNSIEAIESADHSAPGEILVRLERSDWKGTRAAVVAVTDNGPGLSDKDRVHLFDPYYSGRQAGRGLGFGLCKCWSIANSHGGAIEVDSVPHVATTFRVIWPDRCESASDDLESPLTPS
jgi:signal transduction histidine kinase